MPWHWEAEIVMFQWHYWSSYPVWSVQRVELSLNRVSSASWAVGMVNLAETLNASWKTPAFTVASHAPPVWCDTGSLWMRRTWAMQHNSLAAGLANHCRSLPGCSIQFPTIIIFPFTHHFLIARCCNTTPLRTSTSNETPNTVALCKMWCT